MIVVLPGPFKAAFDQLCEAIAYGVVDMDFAVEFTNCVAQGCWGHLNKLLEIAGL